MTVFYHLQGDDFSWDEQKAESNVGKHGVTFEEAAEAFLDPFALAIDASVEGEQREAVIGYSFAHRLLLVVFVERVAATRIISARLATRAERRLYEQS
ncbi:MAG TPA: BrnT family toxin [Longimicrobium sp.]